VTGGGRITERLPSMSLRRAERGMQAASRNGRSMTWALECLGSSDLRPALFFANDGVLSARRRATWNVRIILWAFTSIEHAVVTHDAHDAMTNSVGLGRELWFKLLSGVAVAPTRQQCKFSRIVDA